MSGKTLRIVVNVVAMVSLLLSLSIVVPKAEAQSGPVSRFIVVAKSAGEYATLKAEVQKMGGKIILDQPSIQMLVATGPETIKGKIAANTHALSVAKDHIVQIIPTASKADFGYNDQPELKRIQVGNNGKPVINPDPAMSLPGLMWDFTRIQAPKAWKITTGSHAVKVGVADTGLDYTHSELAPKVEQVVDLTATEDPPLCKTYYGYSDQDWANTYGGPADTDWNGHGSWIGGNIAAVLDGQGINGIAPDVGLVALKISQWCGSAYDSTILNAFAYAADHGIQIVSISFGGYLDLKDPDQKAIYNQYLQTVRYAYAKGTLIIAAAGNEHLRIGPGGLVMSHGPLTTPGADFVDYYGLFENPGGIPLVIDVAATGNVVNATSPTCPDGTADSSTATCKPTSDPHQPFGIGKQDQLAYYSNYGPRIDVAAPGGARKFNLPVWDRGGTPGFPVTDADGTAAWETFSITSNWALEIPCYTFIAPGIFPADQCYSTIQGTSMATPHASGVAALIASANPIARKNPAFLTLLLKTGTTKGLHNTTPPLSATDLSNSDLTGVPCLTGYCHLGGPAIPDKEAYGAGLVNAYQPIR
jgi:lantibiotic leader peptide-processing serine protease